MASTISGYAPVTNRVGVKMITSLQPNEVFVFGSNLSGFHGAGSAGYAMRGITANTWRDDVNFRAIMSGKNPDKRGLWAVFGVGRGFQVGLTGRSYAIPTVERPGYQGIVTESFFLQELRVFVAFAKSHPELTFRVVKLGANRSEGGYSYLGLEAVRRCLDIIREESSIPSNIVFPDELISFPVVNEIKECVEMVTTIEGTSTPGTNNVGVQTNEVVICTSCGENVEMDFYKTVADPRAIKVAWDVSHFKLCEMCINASIIGYDQTGCKFQTPGHCINPDHPGDRCLGHKCPLNTGTMPHRTSLLDGLVRPEPVAKILDEPVEQELGRCQAASNGTCKVTDCKHFVEHILDVQCQEENTCQGALNNSTTWVKCIPSPDDELGTCTNCHTENIEVEEDLDTVLCAPCRKMLYSQGTRARMAAKDGSEVCADCGAPEDESNRFGGFDRNLCLSCRGKEMLRIDAMVERDLKEESQ